MKLVKLQFLKRCRRTNPSSLRNLASAVLILETARKTTIYLNNVKKSKDKKIFKAYLKRRDYKPPFIPAPKDYYITLLSKLPKHIQNKIIDELLVLGRTLAIYRNNPRKLKFLHRDFNIWVNKILDYKNSKKKDLATLTEEEIQKESKFSDKTLCMTFKNDFLLFPSGLILRQFQV